MTKQNIAQIHPVAELFPLLDDAELAELAASIKQNGLLMPIKTDPNGVLLDGRNRLKACEIAGVEPRFEIYDGDAVEYILSINIARRHLNAGQCAVIVALACPAPRKRGRKSSYVSKLETFVPKEQKWFSASRLSEGRAIVKHSRDLALQVAAGCCTFQEALREATMRHRVIKPVVPLPVTTTRLPPRTVTVPITKNDPPTATVRPYIAQERDTATKPSPDRMEGEDDPVEAWLVDWPPEALVDRIFAADRIEPGFARRVKNLLDRRGAPDMRH